MTLFELGKQYLKGERAVRERINVLQKELKGLRGPARLDQNLRIRRLYALAEDAHGTAMRLIRYYEED